MSLPGIPSPTTCAYSLVFVYVVILVVFLQQGITESEPLFPIMVKKERDEEGSENKGSPAPGPSTSRQDDNGEKGAAGDDNDAKWEEVNEGDKSGEGDKDDEDEEGSVSLC